VYQIRRTHSIWKNYFFLPSIEIICQHDSRNINCPSFRIKSETNEMVKVLIDFG
jgi:hypothetical protein